MAALQSDQRRALETVVKQARNVAEQGARAALEGLAVHHHEPHSSMTPAQRTLRARLRAHGRQLGDERDERKGGQQLDRLVDECAYEHWHRMLFASFLAVNELLIEPESGAAVTLDECAELAKGMGRDAWEVAGAFAQRMLPQVFRADDPVLQVALAPETRITLEQLLASLSRAVLLADDSLGWTYQFWQSAEKKRVNESGERITARTLPAVTQLFTEHYMVLFLLHNTIGAWWAAKQIATWTDAQHTELADESAVRRAVALTDYECEYLRFVRDGVTQIWRPAAGAFDSWPRAARELRVLDPCCGSGHFLVAGFELLTRLREHEEGLPRDRAAIAVLDENLFGLELDPRCTQIAAFALAFTAWKRIGHVLELPPLRIACSGLAIHGEREEWARLAGEDPLLRGALESLHATFEQAPELGSLLDPRRADVGGFRLKIDFDRVLPILTAALSRESVRRDAEQVELGVTAQGLALAAELLSGSYTLVVTNVPYLGSKRHSDTVKEWADSHDKEAKSDLATLFLSRMLNWAGNSGTIAVVAPQNWLFLTSYQELRERLLERRTWNILARLGTGAFETIRGQVVNVALLGISVGRPASDHNLAGIDVSSALAPAGKAALLRGERTIFDEPAADSSAPTTPSKDQVSLSPTVEEEKLSDSIPGGYAECSLTLVAQAEQLKNPDARVMLSSRARTSALGDRAVPTEGLSTGDADVYVHSFWEHSERADPWVPFQTAPDHEGLFGGATQLLRWDMGGSRLEAAPGARVQGHAAWGKPGVLIARVSSLRVCLYSTERFEKSCVVLTADDARDLPSILAFTSSGSEFVDEVRTLDEKPYVTTSVFGRLLFDAGKWMTLANDRFPEGLPEPQSNDPTQWLFHGHPAGMVAAGPAARSQFGIIDPVGATRHPSLICREPNPAAVLQVAVARIVGYRWPAELDKDLRLDIASRAWVDTCEELAPFADDDGIVPLAPLRHELAAEARVSHLLRVALGGAWSSSRESTLLADAARANGGKPQAASLSEWLRNRFFEEHCALFHQRPFVWHIWDGRKRDGFGVLVHYHRLAAPNGAGRRLLEKLTHGYLGDWIARQRDEAAAEKEGADARLTAALTLQGKLTKILAGEPPYDIFVRWKALHEQPIGWEPDINDGVRINIRPMVRADILRSTKKLTGLKWTKDRGNEPHRSKLEFPWFWGWDGVAENFEGGPLFTPTRFNDLHYTNAFKQAARDRRSAQ